MEFDSTVHEIVVGKAADVVGALAGRRVVTVALLLIFFAATYGINTILPTGFIPNEDQGVVYINVTAPSGASPFCWIDDQNGDPTAPASI